MYTLGRASRLIKKEGVPSFLDSIESGKFPYYIMSELEKCGITHNGIPQLSLIYQLAK